MSIVCAAPEVGTKKSRNYPCPLGRSLLVFPTSLPMRPHFRPSALPYLSLPHLFQSTAIIGSRNMQVEYRATLYSSQLLLSVSNLTFQTPPSPSPPLSHRLIIIIIIHHPPIHHLTRPTLPPSLHHSRRIVLVILFVGVLFGYTSPPLLLSFFLSKKYRKKKCPRIDGIANIMDVDVILVVVSIWSDIR